MAILLGIAHKVQCLKKKETFDSGGRGGQDPSSYFFQCAVDIDFKFSGFGLNVLFIDLKVIDWLHE